MTTSPGSRFGVREARHDYSGVSVLQGVDFKLRGGKVHGLIGENGSGKSTLIRILTGALRPRAGVLYVDDHDVRFHSPADATSHGVGVVHQDYHLFPELTVAQNVFGVSKSPPRHRLTRTVSHRAVAAAVEQVLHELGIDISASTRVRSLGPAERKLIEVARAMVVRPRFLILDEPTASLEPQAARRILELLDRLREQGVGLAFVSHRLDEVLKVADRVSVLRDGALVSSLVASQATEDRLVALMLGEQGRRLREPRCSRARATAGSEPALRVSGMALRPGYPDVSFSLERGEILGLTGLLGAGPARVVRMIGGAQPLTGRLEVRGKPVRIRTPQDASRAGIGFIPEDRKAAGLVADSSVATNISLASLPAVTRFGFLSHGRVRQRGEEYRHKLQIRCRGVEAPVRTLSGGNQQKVMIAKWLASGVELLVIDEPTHGVDVGGKAQIHDLLRDFTARGGSVLLASTDVHEVVDLCDRIALFRHGTLREILTADRLSTSELAVKGTRDGEVLLEHLVEGELEPEAI